MAVPDWPTTYGYNMFLYPWTTWIAGPFDLFIEHGHRLLGSLVGMITIALLVAIWRIDNRRWIKWLSVVALFAVILQGSLGGMRVVFDQVTLAKIHGCVGPLFFALTVALAVFTSPWWRERNVSAESSSSSRRVQRLAGMTVLMAYIQLVLGAQLRHLPVGVSPSEFRVAVVLHIIFALFVTGHVIAVTARVLRMPKPERKLTRPAVGLAIVVGVQLLLGLGTWISKYGWPRFLFPESLAPESWLAEYTVHAQAFWPAMITTAHVATGSLIIALALLITLRSLRLYGWSASATTSMPLARRALA
jgi:cytochrome c oxidase assembly protein subunit 15